MRVFNFFLFLSFFLLDGGINSYAITSTQNHTINPYQNISKNRHLKIINESNNFILIEDSDIDIEEEYVKDHNLKKQSENNFFCKNYKFANIWNSLLFNRFILSYNIKFFKRISFYCNHSTPIYIYQGVLRI